MEPDDVSHIARFFRGQNLVNSDCDLVLYSVLDRQPAECRSAIMGVALSEHLVLVTIRAAEFYALKFVQIGSQRAIRD